MENKVAKDYQAITWANLQSNDPIIPRTFSITLDNYQSTLFCEKIIRLIPGKRLVALGTWKEMPVVTKLFFQESKAAEHLAREVAGIEALVSVCIPTQKILFQGTDLSKQIYILIYERILNADSLDHNWQNKKDIQAMDSLMHAMTIELATQHVLGILQKDLHFKNFLVEENKIYTIDGSDIKYFEKPLDRELSINNLALFFSQLGIGCSNLINALFQTYIRARGWIVKKQDYTLLENEISKWHKIRWKAYQKKVFRDCSAFGKFKHAKMSVMYDRDFYSSEFIKLLKHPEILFNHPETRIIKSGRSATLAKFTFEGKHFVIKRYNIKNFWHALKRGLRMTRAAKSWKLGQSLRLFGIPTARPIAFIEKHLLGLRGKSYLIMEYIEGPHVGEYFSKFNPDNLTYKKTATEILKLVDYLSRLALTHGDLKMTNILIRNHQPVLIDLDGMKQHPLRLGFKKAYANELKRLMKNWRNKPEVLKMFKEVTREIPSTTHDR